MHRAVAGGGGDDDPLARHARPGEVANDGGDNLGVVEVPTEEERPRLAAEGHLAKAPELPRDLLFGLVAVLACQAHASGQPTGDAPAIRAQRGDVLEGQFDPAAVGTVPPIGVPVGPDLHQILGAAPVT